MANYTYRAHWSPEYHTYVGLCLEFPLHYCRAPTAHQAIQEAERMVEEALAEMAEFGSSPPAPLTDRRYSGRFVIRTSASLHARLTVEATEQGVSLNQ